MVSLKMSLVFVVLVVAVLFTESVYGKSQEFSLVRRRRNINLSVHDFIQSSIKKYGQENAQAAIDALDDNNNTQLAQILVGQTDKQASDDILNIQKYAAEQDPALVKMLGQVYKGEDIPPKEIFEMDDKLEVHPWWRRLREKILQNTDKYIANYISNKGAT